MPLYTIAISLYILFLCINGMIFFVDASTDIGLKTPFDDITLAANVTNTTQPNLFNSTDQSDTLFENATGFNIENQTGPGSSDLLNPIDTILYPISVIQIIIGVLFGTFIFEAFQVFGLPSAFGFIFMGIQGVFAVITALYFITGRG